MFSIRAGNEKIAIGLACALWPLGALAQADGCGGGVAARVAVERADIHLELRLVDGRKLKLRGIEPPRGTPGDPAIAERAREFVNGLVAGREIEAAIAEGAPDRWGRHLAVPVRPVAGGRETLAQRIVAAGWARVEPGEVETVCLAELFRAESAARAARRGLWGDPHYRPLEAAKPAAFQGRAGQIVIVEGRVSSVQPWRTLVFVNFEGRRREAPAAVLTRRLASEMEKAGVPAPSLANAHVRIRGQLQARTPPRIDVHAAGAIEILEAAK